MPVPKLICLQVPVWADAGLLTFPIDSVKNGIALCPSCHAHFDKIIDPGFAFIPTDLDFFINFEIQDRERRRQMQGARRRVPDSEAYRLHQTDNGTIPVDAPGGYYTPIFLQNYFHGGILSTSLLPLLSTPKAWHGEPLAALRRCFLLLGSLRSRSISADTRRKLVRLRDLYFYDDDDNGDGDDGGCPSQRPDRGATNNEKKRNKDSPTPSAPPPSPKRARPSEGKGGQFEYCPVSQRNQWLAWNLGPDVTTNEVVRRYAPLIARSDR